MLVWYAYHLNIKMNISMSDKESLAQANDWLTRRLQYTEEQVREGEDVNTTLTEENRALKEAKTSMSVKVDELTQELQQLRIVVHDHSFEKDALHSNLISLEQKVEGYKTDEEVARQKSEELQCEIDKVQDLLGNNEQEIHDMRIYIQDLEERSGTLEYENNQIKHNTSKVLEEKDSMLLELQRQLNDMEASTSVQQAQNVDGELGSSILLADVDDNDNIHHSSPHDVTEMYNKRLGEKDRSIQELEMRLESVKVTNEIYEDQLNDLQKRLNDSVVEMRHNSTSTDLSLLSPNVDVECQTSPDSDTHVDCDPADPQTEFRNLMYPPDMSPSQIGDCEAESSSAVRLVSDIISRCGVEGVEEEDRCDILNEMLAWGDGVQAVIDKHSDGHVQSIYPDRRSMGTSTPPLIVPEQCDAVVECYLLVDTPHETSHKDNTSRKDEASRKDETSHKDETTHKDMSDIGTNTDTDITSSELSEAVCEICQKRSQPGDSIAVTNSEAQTVDLDTKLNENVSELITCLHQSLCTTSAAISDLTNLGSRSGLFHRDAAQDITPSSSLCTLETCSGNSELGEVGMNLRKSEYYDSYGVEEGFHNKSSSNNIIHQSVSSQHPPTGSTSTQISLQSSEGVPMIYTEEQRQGDHYMSNVLYTATLLLIILLLTSLCACIDLTTYGPSLRQVILRVNGRPSLPPY